jgi:hypothetical protein
MRFWRFCDALLDARLALNFAPGRTARAIPDPQKGEPARAGGCCEEETRASATAAATRFTSRTSSGRAAGRAGRQFRPPSRRPGQKAPGELARPKSGVRNTRPSRKPAPSRSNAGERSGSTRHVPPSKAMSVHAPSARSRLPLRRCDSSRGVVVWVHASDGRHRSGLHARPTGSGGAHVAYDLYLPGWCEGLHRSPGPRAVRRGGPASLPGVLGLEGLGAVAGRPEATIRPGGSD